MSNRKIIFCGTPQISVECMKALIDCNFKPSLVITQPDKIIGRKKEIIFSPVKKFCIENNIKYIQPKKIGDSFDEILNIKPDLIITCAYGQFIPERILEIPNFYSINIHASLLPKYRGGAPIHWSIINGDKKTGITIMEMVKEMDSGDIFFQEEINIDENDTLDSLFLKMEKLAYFVVKKYINYFFQKDLMKYKQDYNNVSFAYNIRREDEKINFNLNDFEIYNKIRGLCSEPGAYFEYNNKVIKVYSSLKTNTKSTLEPGTIVCLNNQGLEIATKNNNIILSEIKIEGKNKVKLQDIKNYHNFFVLKSKIE